MQIMDSMKLIRISLIYSLILFFQACGPSQADLNSAKRAEVIAIHDEVMPKLGQLKAFEKKGLQKVQELAAMDTVDSAKIQELKDLVTELNQAYEGMFVWMRQYEIDEEGRSPEEIKIYLDEQMISVTEVNKAIKDVLAKADSVLAD